MHPLLDVPKPKLARLEYGLSSKERKARWVSGIGTASTAKATSVLAQAARVYAKLDPAFSKRCERGAKKGWAFLDKHPERILLDGKGSGQPLWDDQADYKEVGARLGAEWEALPGRLRARLGTYWEPSRFDGVGGRIHGTDGFYAVAFVRNSRLPPPGNRVE